MGIVQLVERQIVVLDVIGSSPITHPTTCGGADAPHRRSDFMTLQRAEAMLFVSE